MPYFAIKKESVVSILRGRKNNNAVKGIFKKK